jgi:hypothetical protein
MDIIRTIHSVFGEMVLPLVTIAVAAWLTATWKPDQPAQVLGRIFAVLVDIQVALGIIYYIYGVIAGGSLGAKITSMPFLIHPVLGILAAGVAHMAVKPDGPFRKLGRWSVLVGLIIVVILIVSAAMVARMA